MEETFYSPESYVEIKYRKCGIDPERKMGKLWNNVEWWNGVSLPDASKHQCKRCQRDTKLFFDLRKAGKDVSSFEKATEDQESRRYRMHGALLLV